MTKRNRKKMAEIGLAVIAVLICLAGMIVGANADMYLDVLK